MNLSITESIGVAVGQDFFWHHNRRSEKCTGFTFTCNFLRQKRVYAPEKKGGRRRQQIGEIYRVAFYTWDQGRLNLPLYIYYHVLDCT